MSKNHKYVHVFLYKIHMGGGGGEAIDLKSLCVYNGVSLYTYASSGLVSCPKASIVSLWWPVWCLCTERKKIGPDIWLLADFENLVDAFHIIKTRRRSWVRNSLLQQNSPYSLIIYIFHLYPALNQPSARLNQILSAWFFWPFHTSLHLFTCYLKQRYSRGESWLRGLPSLLAGVYTVHCKKKFSDFFPSPAGMSLIKLSLAGNNLIFPGQGEFGYWHPGWGREYR
jgi:hypothetical protein